MWSKFGLILFFLASLFSGIQAQDKILFNFEEESGHLKVSGVKVERDLSNAFAGKSSLAVTALEKKGWVEFSLSETNLKSYHALSFHLYSEYALNLPITLELLAPQNRGGFYTELEPLKAGWQHIYLPLAYWKWKTFGSFGRIQTLKMRFEESAKISLDEIVLAKGTRGAISYLLPLEDQLEFAYGSDLKGIKAFYSAHFEILSKVDFDGSFLVDHCEHAFQRFRELLPGVVPSHGTPPFTLMVFASLEEQQQFWDRLGKKMHLPPKKIEESVYTYQRYFTYVYKEGVELFPLLYQNLQVLLLSNLLGIVPGSHPYASWFIFYLYYFEYPPEPNLNTHMLKLISPFHYTKINEFLNLRNFKEVEKWQACSFVHFMAFGPYREHFPHFLGFISHQRDLKVFFEKTLQVSIKDLDSIYMNFLFSYWTTEIVEK
jgi:hypothetical protein